MSDTLPKASHSAIITRRKHTEGHLRHPPISDDVHYVAFSKRGR